MSEPSQQSNPFDDGYVAPQTEEKTLSCDMKILAILSTVLCFVGSLVIFFLEKKSQYIRLVAIHAGIWHLILFPILIILALLMLINNWFFYVLFAVYLIIYIFFTVFLCLLAITRIETGEVFLIPGIATLARYLESHF